MNRTIRLGIAATLLLATTSVAHAHGSVQCEAVPAAEKKPQMELQQKLVSEGWKVRKVQVYHDCYEVYGFDEKGARVEAFFHQKTFDRVEPDAEQAKQ